jgi:peptide/nickel transport system substrate-binding protein
MKKRHHVLSGARASRPIALILAPALLLLLLTACGGTSGGSGGSGGSAASGGILRLGTHLTTTSMNPFETTQTLSFDSFEVMYPSLVQYNTTTLQIEPDFASSWTTSADGLTWTFHTRPKARWSDGKPLTAADVAWTLTTILKFKAGPTSTVAGNVLGMTSAVATSPTTVVITYAHPVADVLPSLAQVYILPQHVWQQYASGNGKGLQKFANLPTPNHPVVSGGPFVLQKYVQSQVVLFQRNPNYYGQAPHIDGFGYQYFANDDAEVEALKSGQIDAALANPNLPPTDIAPLKAAGFHIVNQPAMSFNDLIINTNPQMVSHRELLNPAVREAFEYATDRTTIDKIAYLGYAQPGGSIIPPVIGQWHNPSVTPLPFSIAKANALLNHAGYRMGSNGIRVADGHPMSYSLLISADNGGPGYRTGQIMANDYRKIGVQLNLQVLGDTTLNNDLLANHYRNFQLAMWGWDTFVDPNYILSVITCGQWYNQSDSGYCNKNYDALFEQQAAATSVAQRKQIVFKMQTIADQARPYIILQYLDVLAAWSKKWCDILSSPDGFNGFFSKDPLVQVRQCGSGQGASS